MERTCTEGICTEGICIEDMLERTSTEEKEVPRAESGVFKGERNCTES